LLDESLSLRPKDAPTSGTEATTTETAFTESSTVKFTESCNSRLNMEVCVPEGWASMATDALLNYKNQEEGRAKAVEEKMRIVNNKTKHIELIKGMHKMSSGKLMSNQHL
jgi:hypothetical protein